MKKSASLEQNQLRQPIAGNVAKMKPVTAKGVKLPPSRRVKSVKPIALLEERFPGSEVHEVTFEYFNMGAGKVFLVGTFNDWQPRTTPMTKQRGGKWSTELMLRPGQYEYRLIIDGQWQDDPMAARFAANPFGGLNSVIEVEPLAI